MSEHYRCDRCGTEMPNRPAGTLRRCRQGELPLFAPVTGPPPPHWDLCEDCMAHTVDQIENP